MNQNPADVHTLVQSAVPEDSNEFDFDYDKLDEACQACEKAGKEVRNTAFGVVCFGPNSLIIVYILGCRLL